MLSCQSALFVEPSRLAAVMATPRSSEYSAVKKHYHTICELLEATVDIAWFGTQLQQECFITAIKRRSIVNSVVDSTFNKFAQMMDAVLVQIKLDTSDSKFISFVTILLKQRPLLGAVTLLRGKQMNWKSVRVFVCGLWVARRTFGEKHIPYFF